MDNNVWEQYGLSEEEWGALSEEEKQSYRSVGQEENKSDEAPVEEVL